MKLKGLPILMIITILAIAGFQGFWLNENYKKEKRDLDMRTSMLFRETVFKLQGSKLNFGGDIFEDSIGSVRMEVNRELPQRMKMRMPAPDAEVVNIVNTLGERIRDSVKGRGVGIYMNKTDMYVRSDSAKHFTFRTGHPSDKIIQLLYDVDSLQEPIRAEEVDSAYKVSLKKENINVPFSISKTEVKPGRGDWEEPGEFNKVRVGITKPVQYELKVGNSFGYIMKRMSSPLLFSLFLVGVTILSFVLLYRSLLRQKKLAVIKNEFISNITHELKTPIATVGVAIEALRNFNAMNDPARSKEYLDISQNELHRLSLLVDKVLKLSMFEKKEIELKYEDIDMKGIVDEVVSSMRLQIEKCKAKVTVTSQGHPQLEGDQLHLLSVVFNLLDNALKYGNSEPVIHVEIQDEAEKIILSIKDNGIGIAPEYHDKLFEKFFRVPTGNTHNAKGYGLGLSYASHVVERHKGTITVKSEPGIGTLFTITLPKRQS